MARKNEKARAWWTKLSPEKRAQVQARQVADGAAPRELVLAHHRMADVACLACGTDSTVGCLAGETER